MGMQAYTDQQNKFIGMLNEIAAEADVQWILHKCADILEAKATMSRDKYGRQVNARRKAELKTEAHRVRQIARHTLN